METTSLMEELRMKMGFWWNVDSICHRLPLVPHRIRNWICDRAERDLWDL